MRRWLPSIPWLQALLTTKTWIPWQKSWLRACSPGNLAKYTLSSIFPKKAKQKWRRWPERCWPLSATGSRESTGSQKPQSRKPWKSWIQWKWKSAIRMHGLLILTRLPWTRPWDWSKTSLLSRPPSIPICRNCWTPVWTKTHGWSHRRQLTHVTTHRQMTSHFQRQSCRPRSMIRMRIMRRTWAALAQSSAMRLPMPLTRMVRNMTKTATTTTGGPRRTETPLPQKLKK